MSGKHWGTVYATKDGVTTPIELYHGQNSFGEPDIFAGTITNRLAKEFGALTGYPLYAIQTWLVGHGYTYEVK